ncbi:hypothetical protein CLU79DRAFT_741267 [Phycomyces nitens]|nr:hypothetical protein CLU79DRAFT_741267 [Phycomyces nitens]
MLCLYLVVDNLKLSTINQDSIKTAAVQAINLSADLCVLVSSSSTPVDDHWNEIQSLLGTINVIQLQEAYANHRPLSEFNVVFESWCGYEMALEPNLSKVIASAESTLTIQDWSARRSNAGLGSFEIQILPTATTDCPTKAQPLPSNQVHPFSRVALGGTFDHIHAGHKILLTMAALLTHKSIVVGVTDDSMLHSKKYPQLIQSTKDRVKGVERYLYSIRRSIEPCVVPICDPFGPTITDPAIDALVCSKETLQGGEAVNRERQKRGMSPIELRVIDVISPTSTSIGSQDMSALKISSSWIRQYLAKDL